MTVLDASALIAYLADEPAAEEVAQLLRKRPPPSISAVNLIEVIDDLVRVKARTVEEVKDAVDLLIATGLEVQPLWLPDARRSAARRAAYYDRRTSPLSLADCACLATAVALKTDLATSDPALAAAARAEGVAVVPLPNSLGELPG